MNTLATGSFFRDRPLVAWPAALYLGFVAVTILAWRVLLFLWPYPLILCLQKVIPSSLWAFVAAWTLGLGAILGTGAVAQRLVGHGKPGLLLAVPFSFLVGAAPLFLIEFSAWVLAASLGWPYGE